MAGTPFTELGQFAVDPASVRLLELSFCLQHSVVVLGHAADREGPVVVGMLEPDNRSILGKVRGELKRPVQGVQLNAYEIRAALARGFDLPVDREQGLAPLLLSAQRSMRFESEQRPSQIIDDLLSSAVREGASTIHIESYRLDVDLRLRVDGVLRQVTTPLSPDNILQVISRLKVLSDCNISVRQEEQDGRFAATYQDAKGKVRVVNFRTSFIPGPYGEDVVIRILDQSRLYLRLNELGMDEEVLGRFLGLLRCPSGLILFAGPTGSGKTTTAYCAIQRLRGEEKKIVTVEDPIEYEFAKVNQKGTTKRMGFADYSRAFLRQDPDVMFVGEVRDRETAQACLQAANTGHLVLSTVHAIDAVATVTRLRSLDVPDGLIVSALLGVVSQRLVRRLCEQCKAPYDYFDYRLRRYFKEIDPQEELFTAVGCDACSQTGYQGTTGVFELLVADGEFLEAVGRGESDDLLRKRSLDGGAFISLVDHAVQRVRAGLTSLEEVERTVRPRIL